MSEENKEVNEEKEDVIKKNVMMSFPFPNIDCKHCGGKHDLTLAQLYNWFEIEGSVEFSHFASANYGSFSEPTIFKEEDVPEDQRDRCIPFQKPYILDGNPDGRTRYDFWSFCPVNEEPLFFKLDQKIDESKVTRVEQ